MSNKVFIVLDFMGCNRLFKKWGFEVVDNMKDADIVLWTGGGDINPSLYDQAVHPLTSFNNVRDTKEVLAFQLAKSLGKNMVGICRGAQLLNVLLGGKLYQHVDKHTSGNHPMLDLESGETLDTTSAHHQMMIPTDKAKVIATATQATLKQYCGKPGSSAIITRHMNLAPEPDIEALYYEEDKAFLVQGHPEWAVGRPYAEWFMEKISDKFGLTIPGIPRK